MIQGRYLVVHLIGKGGMGEVYLAVDQRLGSAVALKRTSFAENELLAAAFEREAKILARLRHPVLPKVSDHFAENGDQFLVMEHISGDDLSKRLESAQKPFPVSWVMFWADQLLDALSYLHSHEPPIIHRDIKPHNLKLTDENHIVLLDFGLSKDTANNAVASAPGTSGSVVGYTPHFAPMEQIRGTGTNPRSDIYSLSATLYQLMTDTVPPDALTRADAMLNGQIDPVKPLSDINHEISPAVSNVILKGLEVSQEKRFATATEMQKSLRAAYAQIQGEMSANTVAFNIGDRTGADPHQSTPPIDEGRSVAPSEMATATPSSPVVSTPPVFIPEAPSMEATIRMDAPQVQEAIRQSDVKTAVFLSSDIASSSTDTPPSPFTDEGKSAPPPVSSTATAAPSADFEPAATVPLIHMEEELPAKAGAPTDPEFFQTVAVAASPTPPPPANANVPEAPQLNPPPSPKKKSKAGLILGLLALLFILIGVAAAGGWYAYTKYVSSTVKPTPSPSVTPSPSPSPSATVEPTPSPTVDSSETNSNSNSNLTIGDNSNDNSNTVSPTPGPTAGPVATRTPQVAPTKDPSVTKPQQTPATKPTPKPKPSNDRTVILQ